MNARRFLSGLLLAGALLLLSVESVNVQADTSDVVCDASALIAAIDIANANGVPDMLNLAAGCTYTLTAVDNDTGGPNGLPAITSEISVNGNGATIYRQDFGGVPEFRLFYVADSGQLALDRLSLIRADTERDGGALLNAGGTVTLTLCTVSGNHGGRGGGIYNSGVLHVTDSTLASNWARTAASGDGIQNASGGSVTLRNTILAGETNCAGDPVTSLGYNLDSGGTCNLAAVGDLSNTDPLLNYGLMEPYNVHRLREGSPAIDQGSCQATDSVAVDQRGMPRPVDVPGIDNADDGCDMGAYEFTDAMMTVAPPSLASTVELGQMVVRMLMIDNNGPVPLDYTVHVPAPVGGIDILLPFDEAAGATGYLDLSGKARQASCTGTSCPTAGVSGKVGTALRFDGVNDSVDTDLYVDQSGGPVTMMAWVRPGSTSAGRHMVFSTDDGGYDWSLLREGATWRVFTGENSRSTGLSVDVGQWQHVAAVFDDGWGRVQFYKNGVEAVIPYLDWDASSSDLAIGNRPVTRNRPFDGRIDEVHVYNRALDATEIQAFYDQSRDLAWLSYDPGIGTVPAYSSASVEVTLDAGSVPAGAYGARIGVVGGPPANARFRVPVRMIAGLAWNEVSCDADHLIAALEIANANGVPDTLELASGCIYTLIDGGLPSITSQITINGNGATVDAQGVGPVFYVADSGDLTLNQLTVTGGSFDGDFGGGGIANRGTLTVVDSEISGNGAQIDAGGCGGGLYNQDVASATLIDSRITGNGVDRHSGGGGGLCNEGTMTLIGCTVSGNDGGPSGGGILNAGTLEIFDSTVSGNRAFAFYDEMAGSGGGIENSGTLTLRNSTVSGNSTWSSGGGVSNPGTATLINSTVTGNDVSEHEGDCGGICGGTVILRNTVVADQGFGADCSLAGETTIVSQGYNLDSDGTCSLTQATDQPNVAPLLGPLQDNGGSTETHALLEASPAIDQGSCPQTMADQRGLPRHVDAPGIENADDACDVGAYEVQDGTPLGVVAGTITAASTGAPLAARLALLPTSQTTISDPGSGAYSIWWATGTYTLQVSAPGYFTQTASVELDALVASRQDFALELERVQLFLPIVFR